MSAKHGSENQSRFARPVAVITQSVYCQDDVVNALRDLFEEAFAQQPGFVSRNRTFLVTIFLGLSAVSFALASYFLPVQRNKREYTLLCVTLFFVTYAATQLCAAYLRVFLLKLQHKKHKEGFSVFYAFFPYQHVVRVTVVRDGSAGFREFCVHLARRWSAPREWLRACFTARRGAGETPPVPADHLELVSSATPPPLHALFSPQFADTLPAVKRGNKICCRSATIALRRLYLDDLKTLDVDAAQQVAHSLMENLI